MRVNVSTIDDLYRIVNAMSGDLATKRDGSLWDNGGFVSMPDAISFATAINTRRIKDSTIPKGKDGKDGEDGEDGNDGKNADPLTWRGRWEPSKYYSKNDIVRWDGSAFIWVEDRIGQGVTPSTERPWELFVQRGEGGRPGGGGGGGGASVNPQRLIPTGGQSGQILSKSSNNNYDTQWVDAASGDGQSAYDIAVENGFTGTESEWLESLAGAKGDDGDSAYQIAVTNGFSGTEAEWLTSLVGQKGDAGDDGDPGSDGDSAYEVAIANGFVGTEAEWLASLVGADGATEVSELTDVSITGLESGDLLYYDGTIFKPIKQNQLAVSGGISSDIRLKQDIEEINYSINDIKNLQPVSFSYKLNPKEKHIGFIAQDLMQIIPDAVKEGKDGYLVIEYQAVVTCLVECIKNLNKRIETLENK
jgi:hypothetical protein